MWYWYALVAMACFATMQLVFAWLSRQGVATPAMLMFVFAFGATFYIVHVRVMQTPMPPDVPTVPILGVAAVLSYVGNLCSVRALASAPNPGYAVAVVGVQSALVTAVAVAAFGATLSWTKAIGVALCIAGVALLVI